MNADATPHVRPPNARRRTVAVIVLAAAGALALAVRLAWRGLHAGDRAAETSAAADGSDAGPVAELAASGNERRTARGMDVASRPIAPFDASLIPPAAADQIAGYVVDEQGTPLAGVRLDSFAVNSWLFQGRETTYLFEAGGGVTDSRGCFRWRPTWRRPCWIRINTESDWRSDAVDATMGGSLVRIVALRRERVRVRVLDAKGRPLRGAAVSIRAAFDRGWPRTLDVFHASDWPTAVVAFDSTTYDTVTDDEGRATSPIPDRRARIALLVTPTRDRDDLMPLEVDPWDAPPESTLRLFAGLATHGNVVDTDGRAVTNGMVRYTPEHGRPREVRVEFDGTFVLPPLAAGPVRLEAIDRELLAAPEPRSTVVAAGTRDAVVVLDVGRELVVHVTGRPEGGGGSATLALEGAPDSPRGATTAPLDRDGTVVLRGLRDDERYTLWIPAVLDPAAADLSDALTGIVHRVGITTHDSPLTLEARPGKTLEVEVLVAGKPGDQILEEVTVSSRGARLSAPFNSLTLGPVETTPGAGPVQHAIVRFGGVSDGEWTVTCVGSDFSTDAAAPLHGEASAPAGGRVRIVMEPGARSPR